MGDFHPVGAGHHRAGDHLEAVLGGPLVGEAGLFARRHLGEGVLVAQLVELGDHETAVGRGGERVEAGARRGHQAPRPGQHRLGAPRVEVEHLDRFPAAMVDGVEGADPARSRPQRQAMGGELGHVGRGAACVGRAGRTAHHRCGDLPGLLLGVDHIELARAAAGAGHAADHHGAGPRRQGHVLGVVQAAQVFDLAGRGAGASACPGRGRGVAGQRGASRVQRRHGDKPDHQPPDAHHRLPFAVFRGMGRPVPRKTANGRR